MSESKDKEDTEKKISFDRASLNSGLKYYELILRSMEATMIANIRGDYETWISMLYQIWNWMKPFVESPDAITTELKNIISSMSSMQKYSQKMKYSQNDYTQNIRFRILEIEGKMYEKTKYMLLPTSKGANSELDWSRLALG